MSDNVPTKRKPGRPKGHPRAPNSGRQRGTPNKATTLGREFLLKRSRALEVLCDIAAGRKMMVGDPDNPGKRIGVYPSEAARLKAAMAVADKLVPDQRSVEHTGDGAQVGVTVVIRSFRDATPADLVDARERPPLIDYMPEDGETE